jgi:hypothetical protein
MVPLPAWADHVATHRWRAGLDAGPAGTVDPAQRRYRGFLQHLQRLEQHLGMTLYAPWGIPLRDLLDALYTSGTLVLPATGFMDLLHHVLDLECGGALSPALLAAAEGLRRRLSSGPGRAAHWDAVARDLWLAFDLRDEDLLLACLVDGAELLDPVAGAAAAAPAVPLREPA